MMENMKILLIALIAVSAQALLLKLVMGFRCAAEEMRNLGGQVSALVIH